MQAGGNSKFIAYAKENSLQGVDIAVKYTSHAAAIYAARLKALATGEPYVAPAAQKRSASVPPALSSSAPAVPMANSAPTRQMQSMSSTSYGSQPTMTATNTGGFGYVQTSSGGIGSAAASRPQTAQQPFAGFPGAGNLNDVGKTLSKNLSNVASQMQSADVVGNATKAAATAGKVAAQAGGFLSSWLSTAASQAQTYIQDGTDSRGSLRSDLRRNLGTSNGASQAGFQGFSSDDFQRSYGAGTPTNAAPVDGDIASNGPAQSANPSTGFVQTATGGYGPVQPPKSNSAWGGFDGEKKNAWGTWE